MTEEAIAKEIKNEVLVNNFKRYFDTLEDSCQEPFKNSSWRKAQLLYNSLNYTNRENLQEFVKMIMIEQRLKFCHLLTELQHSRTSNTHLS